MIFNG